MLLNYFSLYWQALQLRRAKIMLARRNRYPRR